MTTPSTTILIDGTVDGAQDGDHTSEATSFHDHESPVEEHATRRHHLENLAIPSVQVGQEHPSAASFNASLDQMESQRNSLHSPLDPRQGHDNQTPPQPNGHHVPDNRNNTPTGNPVSQLPNPGNLTSLEERQPTAYSLDGTSTYPPDEPRTDTSTDFHPASAPPSIHPSIQQPPAPSTTNQPLTVPPTTQRGRSHNHRRRRRLLRWLRHPLPWNLSFRRRAENIRRRIMDVDRVLP